MNVALSIDEIRKISLAVMDEIHNYCVLNGLRYSLFHGSLLGAVRHSGFIPWDDDMDIAMPRSDYEFFINNFSSSLCKVVSCNNDSSYYLPWAKVSDNNTVKIEHIRNNKCILGVNIDIYPVDTVGEDIELDKIIKKRKRLERYREYSLCVFKNPFKKLFSMFFSGKSNKYSRIINKTNQMFSNNKPSFFITTEVYNVKRALFSLDMFNNLLLVKFEDRKYFISKNYDELLTKRLGNYMILPPPEDRIRHHDFVVYYK